MHPTKVQRLHKTALIAYQLLKHKPPVGGRLT